MTEVFFSSCCNANTFDAAPYTNPSTGRVGLILGHHTPATAPKYTYYPDSLSPSSLYTTTRGDSIVNKTYGGIVQHVGADDHVALVQTTGYPVFSYVNLTNHRAPRESAVGKTFANPDSAYLDNFRRPTTIAIEGKNSFAQVYIEPVKWWYNTYEATAPTAWADVMDPNDPEFAPLYNAGKILDMSGPLPVPTVPGTYPGRWHCCSGAKTLREYTVEWKQTATKEGTTLLDAAVQLTDASETCIAGDVKDNTGAIAEAPSSDSILANRIHTNALITVPFADRFTLRTTGNFYANLGNERDSVTSRRVLYGLQSFPDPDAQVYLMPSAANQTAYSPVYSLGDFNNNGAIYVPSPYHTTNASLFGVYGAYDYDGLMANIHTLSSHDGNVPGATHPSNTTAPGFSVVGDNNHGVIEVGTGFAQGAASGATGYDKFHIYSGGTVKNFEGWCNGPADNYEMNFTTSGNTPAFYLDADEPAYILNVGNNGNTYRDADINFKTDGITKLKAAFTNAQGNGAMHIQARGDVKFMDRFDPVIKNNNELRLLSSQGTVQLVDEFLYTNNLDTNLVIWAKGSSPYSRSCIGDTVNAGSGLVYFGKKAEISQNGNTAVTLIRSESDDIVMADDFTYTNVNGPANGEFIMQAGQDLYGSNVSGGKNITFNQTGEKAILLEAKKTIHTRQNLVYDRTGAKAGNIILKAGYDSFSDSANISLENAAAGRWNMKGNCIAHSYPARGACSSTDGGDIWLEGNAIVNLSGTDTVQTVLRAWNSIYMDSSFIYNQSATGDVGGNTLLYAEQGNIEAIVDSVVTSVSFRIDGTADESELRLQAGNLLWNEGNINRAPVAFPACYSVGGDNGAEYDGNILFNKPLRIENKGRGYTLLSAGRDIENQIQAPFEFKYDNVNADSFYMTAGRHIETHAMVRFNHENTHASLVMQAGRLNSDTQTDADDLCKTVELGTSLAESGSTPKLIDGTNSFAKGGSGHGSILLFDSLEFNYNGDGRILMTALNGNIESDPYLHRNDNRPNVLNPGTAGYDAAGNIHNAPVVFNHGGTGITRLEAIDIRLHDRIEYNGSAARLQNGQFYLSAFDSILTRNLSYRNATDTGSVFITTDKLKRGGAANAVLSCGEYLASSGGGGINQGHIVLGYGADCSNANINDRIVFNFAGNPNLYGANVLIRAGYDGFLNNPVTGRVNSGNLFKNHPKDRNKGYGGNITFDHIQADMAKGNHTAGGSMEISTPNGNIWGKDSISYNAWNGDLLMDAGLGSLEDTLRATRWSGFSGPLFDKGNGHEDILNTNVPYACGDGSEWRTGNIMLKGAAVTFNDGAGNVTFRTREGFIDTYDAFTVSGMQGHLVKYAGMDNPAEARNNNWGDVSERDFRYTPTAGSGSVFFGADDNIMLNYGNSNFMYGNYGSGGMGYPGNYDVVKSGSPVNAFSGANPWYHTDYEGYIKDLCAATFNVNADGYLFYRNPSYSPNRKSHLLYRGCINADCSGITGDCVTTSNGARDLTLDFRNSNSGGFASVASNYIDIFTKFDYRGGTGSGLHPVPGMNTLHGESVSGYGLYMKSQFNGAGSNYPEKRRATCEGCGQFSSFPMDGESSREIPEMTYIGFHDDARIHTHNQKSYLDAPVLEFFGHAEMDAETNRGNKTGITLKADSLIFHDSVIFAGRGIELKPYTTDAAQRAGDMRYGVINDRGRNRANYSFYGPAIEMTDRGLPVLELGYQRCNEPGRSPNSAPNVRSLGGKEQTPTVGGDMVVAFKYGYAMPMFNTVVANHARISFISDSLDHVAGGEYIDAFIRTDLLRIRNKVEFYTDPAAPSDRKGKFVMATPAQMDDKMVDPGMYTRHLHMERGSELSLPGEDSLTVIPTTVVGGYGNIHENVMVKANGILAPGFASLMEGDCQTPYTQGKLTVHNLQMEKDAVLRLSISNRNCVNSPDGPIYCTQTDTIVVQDTVFLTDGRVSVVILPETETLDPGCYLFMIYGDSTGISQEYVKNFVLRETRYGDFYYSLYFGERGKVYLCVSTFPTPVVQRWIDIPEVPGVTTVPGPGRSHVFGHQNFTFTARFSGSPLKIRALGYYSGENRDLDYTGKLLDDGSYRYTIYQVVQPWTVYIGPDPSGVSNEGIPGQRIWTYRNTLYINAAVDDVVSIYNLTGVLYRKVDIPAGTNKLTLERGMYVVTLKDGSVHRIIIK
jgi:hypothetical protein